MITIVLWFLIMLSVNAALLYAFARLWGTKVSLKRVGLLYIYLILTNAISLALGSTLGRQVGIVILLGITFVAIQLLLSKHMLKLSFWRTVGVMATAVVPMVGVSLLLRAVSVESFYVPTDNMAPTILSGERILVDKMALRFAELRRGDVVVFEQDWIDPMTRDRHPQTLVNRIAGLPGETVEIKRDEVLIDGRSVGTNLHSFSLYGPSFEGQIPPGKVYMVGDAEQCFDSRMYGLVDIASIKGKVVLIFASVVPAQPQPSRRHSDERAGQVRWARLGTIVH